MYYTLVGICTPNVLGNASIVSHLFYILETFTLPVRPVICDKFTCTMINLLGMLMAALGDAVLTDAECTTTGTQEHNLDGTARELASHSDLGRDTRNLAHTSVAHPRNCSSSTSTAT